LRNNCYEDCNIISHDAIYFYKYLIHKVALVNPNYFITKLLNNHRKKHKNNTNNNVSAYIRT